ncbi:MAG: ribosomal protein [Rhodoglobus sp.]|nr:ribosomal protein [Rhodoglobus sp.]
MTHQYELMVILDPEIDERTVAPSLDKFLNVIRNDGGSIDNVDIWGRRRLAYEINKKNEGIYAVVNFTANSSATVELDRQLKLSEAVMRTKVLRAEEGFAQVAAAKKLADEKAARKAAAPAKAPAASAAAAPAAAPAPAAEKAPAAAKAAEKAPAAAKADATTGDEASAAKPAAKKPAPKVDKEAE